MTTATEFGQWRVPESKPVVVANGMTYDVEPGADFAKTIMSIASAAGFRSNFYVRVAHGNEPAVFIASQELAPSTIEVGDRVDLSPHSEAA